MFSQAIRRWLAPARPIRSETRRFHPGLEMLEDRAVPAGFVVAGADAGGPPLVSVLADNDHNGTYETRVYTFRAFDARVRGGVRVATGDFDGDGNDELVAAAGSGAGGVRIFNLNPDGTVTLLEEFKPYGTRFRGGVFVAAGDITGDGRDDLVTGAGGGRPRVKIFSDLDRDGFISDNQTDSFLAYPHAFRGGVRVAVGQIGGTVGQDELITGPGPGPAQPVKIWRDAERFGPGSGAVSDDPLLDEFFPFGAAFSGGVFVAASQVGIAFAGGGNLVVGRDQGPPQVKIFVDIDGPFAAGAGSVSDDPVFESFLAYPRSFRGGVRVALGDTDPGPASSDKLLIGPGPGRALPVQIRQDSADVGRYLGDNPPGDSFLPLGAGFSRGFFVAFGEVTRDAFVSAAPPRPIIDGATTTSSIFVPPSAGVVRDLNVSLNISHPYVDALVVTLSHFNSDGSSFHISLFTNVGGLGNGFILHLDDEAGASVDTLPDFEDDITHAGTYRLQGAARLSTFDGLDASGEWRLTIADDADPDGGTLFSWSLLITY
jgi:hypothetical protein